MAEYVATIPSSWTQNQTFDFLADFRNVAQWDPSMRRAELLSGTPGRPGARYLLVMQAMGREIELEYEAIEVQRPGRFVLRSETSSAELTDTVTVAKDGAVTYDAKLELRGLRKIADPLASMVLTRSGEKARKSLERTLAGPVVEG